MAGAYDAETVKESELSDFKNTTRETLEDIFARVDTTLSQANVSSAALGKGGEAHDALITELTAALDEVRGKWRKAEVEMRTYSQATGGALMAQMPSEIATLTSRAELAEAQARRAEKIVQTLKAEIRVWRSSATSDQLDSVKESLASAEALAVTAGSTDEEEVSTLRRKLADVELAHSKLQSEVALTRVELASARAAPKPSEDQAKIAALQQEGSPNAIEIRMRCELGDNSGMAVVSHLREGQQQHHFLNTLRSNSVFSGRSNLKTILSLGVVNNRPTPFNPTKKGQECDEVLSESLVAELLTTPLGCDRRGLRSKSLRK